MESLDVANRFLYTGDDARFAACERALAQVIMTLQRLVKVWKVRDSALADSLFADHQTPRSPS